MNIHNGSLYWPQTTLPFEPQEVHERLECYDIVIVGGGMSGSLTAFQFMKAGKSVAVLDKRQFGSGSTSANTGLLQYSNDIMLHELIEQIGEPDAVRFYEMCLEAMDQLDEVATLLPVSADFIRRPSICYASVEEDVAKLQKEYETLKAHGFPCEYWDQTTVEVNLPFSKPAALVTYKDAEVNPLKFVQGVLGEVEKGGGHLFPYTEVEDVFEQADHLEVRTSNGTFHAKKIVYTTGYETVPVGKRIGADINRSYAIATKPVEDISEWHERALIWETKRPYLYMRLTEENAVVVGGLDEDKPEAPLSDELIAERGQRLLDALHEHFPKQQFEINACYAASFGESIDNLPFIGEHPTKPNHYYLLGYGGNGTVYSMLGSSMLVDLVDGVPNRDAEIVQLDRKYGVK